MLFGTAEPRTKQKALAKASAFLLDAPRTVGYNMIMKELKEIVGERLTLALEETLPPENGITICYYKICLNQSKEMVGECGAKLGMNDEFYYIGNISYRIEERFRGNGYAPEAVKLLFRLFKLNGYSRVIITNSPENHASIRVCEKVGAKLVEVAKVPKNHLLYKRGEKVKNIWQVEL